MGKSGMPYGAIKKTGEEICKKFKITKRSSLEQRHAAAKAIFKKLPQLAGEMEQARYIVNHYTKIGWGPEKKVRSAAATKKTAKKTVKKAAAAKRTRTRRTTPKSTPATNGEGGQSAAA